jgi:sigma-70-like protein
MRKPSAAPVLVLTLSAGSTGSCTGRIGSDGGTMNFGRPVRGCINFVVGRGCQRVACGLRRRHRRWTGSLGGASAREVSHERGQRLRGGNPIGLAILNMLPESQREVFVLYEVEELSGSEIADLLGISVGTVRSRLRLARKRVRPHLLDQPSQQ